MTPVAPLVMADDDAGEIILMTPAPTPSMLEPALQRIESASAMTFFPGATDLNKQLNRMVPSGSRARALPSQHGRFTSS